MKFALSALFVAFSVAATAQEPLPKSITLAATDWCPFTCAVSQNGRVETSLRRHLANIGIELEIVYYPWVRALQLAETGLVDGVVTLAYGESEILLRSDKALGHYQDCFYRQAGSNWRYTGIESFSGDMLGVVGGYGYSREIDAYVAANPAHVAEVHGIQTNRRLIGMVNSGRVDVAIAERGIAELYLPTHQNVQSTGCLAAQPIYMGLNPDKPWSQTLISQLNKELSHHINPHEHQ